MNITQRVQKWGNSSAVRIPKKVLDQAKIDTGEELRFEVRGHTILLTPTQSSSSLDSLLGRISPKNIHGESTWDQPVGNEVW